MSTGTVVPPPPQPKASISADALQATPTSVSDSDRLIAVLQSCFQDLINKQDEQSKKQVEQSEKIHNAVKTLKSQEPVTDKETAFWNAYMKLADEYDKDFQAKYGTDLDTALIFSGLFSAVSSAFIIQIQPQVMVPGSVNPKVLVAQCMLYVSLFTTLLAALLAVLGKQWIIHYQAAGSRGTIAARGIERQQKLDGLRKWKFDAVLQMFPLLLQLALLLFAIAISVYLWTVHLSIAIIVLVFTSIGFGLYLVLLGSAIISRNSPFQTSLAPFLIKAFSASIHILKTMFTLTWRVIKFVTVKPKSNILPQFTLYIGDKIKKGIFTSFHSDSHYLAPSWEAPAVLWVLETSTNPIIIDHAVEIGNGLQWPIDNDYDLLSAMAHVQERFMHCFDTHRDLDWDATSFKFHQDGTRFKWATTLDKVRKGQIHCAINCGKLYCSLRLISRASGHLTEYKPPYGRLLPCSSILADTDDQNEMTQLLNVIQLVTESPQWVLDWTRPDAIQWALHVISSLRIKYLQPHSSPLEHFLDQFADTSPNLHESSFTNYLCCLNSILGSMDPRVVVVVNKKDLKTILMTRLFQELQVTSIGTPLVTRIINTTAELANKAVGISYHNDFKRPMKKLLVEMSHFCATFPRVDGWLDVLATAATLTRFETKTWNISYNLMELKAQDIEWIYLALDHIQQSCSNTTPDTWNDHITLAVESLLQPLACKNTLSQKPPSTSLEIILKALSASGYMALVASMVLWQQKDWLLDQELQLIMQDYSIWSKLGCVALNYPDEFAECYIEIGAHISNTPSWKSHLYQDLPTWITVGPHRRKTWGPELWSSVRQKGFMSVICNVWVPDSNQHKLLDKNQKSWALAITALSNVWKKTHFLLTPSPDLIQLTKCTVSTSLYIGPWYKKMIAGPSREIFAAELGITLVKAAETAQNVVLASPDNNHFLEQLAQMLEALGHKISSEFKPGSGEVVIQSQQKRYLDWEGLKGHFMTQLDALEESLMPEHLA